MDGAHGDREFKGGLSSDLQVLKCAHGVAIVKHNAEMTRDVLGGSTPQRALHQLE